MTTPTTAAPAAEPAAPAVVVAPVPGSPEYNAAMIARADKAAGVTPAEPAATPARPEWLPEKFKTPEELTAAYKALETKLGTAAPATPAVPLDKTVVQTNVANAGLDWNGLNTEFAEKGALSPETYAKLAEKGFPKEAVDTYIAGQQAKASSYDAAAAEAAGSADALKTMLSWAGTKMTKGEADAFNAATASGDTERMKLAISGLRARYEASEGTTPNLIAGGNTKAGDVSGYESQKQMTTDMRNPLYKTDPAFRKKVEARVAATTAF